MKLNQATMSLVEYTATIDSRRNRDDYIDCLREAAYKTIYKYCDKASAERPYHLQITDQAILFELILAAERSES